MRDVAKRRYGGVTRAALYKPLAEKDNKTISIIIKTTQAFMRKVSLIFAVALIVFAAVYPIIINREFEWFFSFTLIIIIGSSTFFANFFGITYQLLLRADQKNYIVLLIQSGTVIANTVVASFLLLNGYSLHIVKLGSALVYTIQPFVMLFYCKRHYQIDTSVQADSKYIAQRWDAFAQRIALFVHSNTDIIVLSTFMTLADVSIYSVHSYIVLGIEQIVKSLCVGVDAAFGNLLISTDVTYTSKKFEEVEYAIFSITTILFTATALLIAPFISLYTRGVNDANYSQPLFALLFILAEVFFCIRTPYQDLVEASGVFRDMRNGAIAEMLINICLSVVLVNTMGLVGVVVGTLIAMVFRTLQYIVYLSKHILKRSIWIFSADRDNVPYIANSIFPVYGFAFI